MSDTEAPEGPDLEAMRQHFAEILHLLGLNAEDDRELNGTPMRLAELWVDQFAGLDESTRPVLRVLPTSGDQEDMIMVRELPFVSTCAHHFMPFFGKCAIAYIPGSALVGVGAPGRVLQFYARRPQIQERMGEQIANFMMRALEPRGLMVHVVARHMCMEARGVRGPGIVESTATRGWFSDQEWRSEFFERLARPGTV